MCRYIVLDKPRQEVGCTRMGTRLVILNEQERFKIDAYAIIEMYANEKDKHKDKIFLSRKAFETLARVIKYEEDFKYDTTTTI